MDISVLTTTNDIEQLRTLALAMVQKVMAENEEKEKLQQRIRLLEEMLKLARRQRFGKKRDAGRNAAFFVRRGCGCRYRRAYRPPAHPESRLHGWKGKLVVDGHKAYRTLANKVVGITLAGCWAHARRGFAELYKANKDPRAAMATRKIAGVYKLEKKVSHRRAG